MSPIKENDVQEPLTVNGAVQKPKNKYCLQKAALKYMKMQRNFWKKADGDGIIQNCAVNAIYLKIISAEKSRVKSGIFQEYSMKMDCGE